MWTSIIGDEMKRLKIFLLTLIFIINSSSLVLAESKEKKIDNIKWEEETIYFILTDRFYDGDKSNNKVYGEDSYDLNHLEAYHGGDFQGIIDKVDYLKELGITTLWITPIVKNIEMNHMTSGKQYAYHGYWAEDFTKLDPHLGDEEKLKELIDVLADNGIKLMVDVVLNHSGYATENLPQFRDMIRSVNGAGDIESSLAGLPDFKTEEKAVRDKLIEWQSDWIKNLKTKNGNSISYFRVDTVKHVDKETWKEFKSAIHQIDPKFKLMGEIFDGTISNNRNYLDPSMMDSVLDFDFKGIAKKLTKGKFKEVEDRLGKRNAMMKDGKSASQFLSSHDEHGFLKMKLNDDKNLFKAATTLQLTAKGIPVIYYGEEIGMSGQKDDFSKGIFSENRASFKWENVKNNDILDHYKKILKIKNSLKEVFAYGNRKMLYSDENVYVFERSDEGSKVVTAINISEEPQEVKVKNTFTNGKLYDLYNDKKITASAEEISLKVPSSKDGATSIIVEEDKVPADFPIAQSGISRDTIIIVAAAIVLFAGIMIYRKRNR